MALDTLLWVTFCSEEQPSKFCYSWPWPAVYITFVQITHQIQVLTEHCAQAIFYALPNNQLGTK